MSLLQKKKDELAREEELNKDLLQAQILIQRGAEDTQNQITYHINDIVTAGIQAVFGENVTFHVNFSTSRGRSEADMYVMEGDHKINLMNGDGYSLADTVSFCLKFALWALEHPSTNNVLIFDEPFKNLSAEYWESAGEMIKIISKELHIQIIMTTHNNVIGDTCADRNIKVKKKGEYSTVEWSDV